MADGEDKADEFTFVCRQRAVAWRGRPAEERHRMLALEKHGAKPVRGCIALDDEKLGEVGQDEDGRRGDGRLEGGERCRCLGRPREPLLAEEGRQGCSDCAKLPNKLVVVPRKAKESPDCPR